MRLQNFAKIIGHQKITLFFIPRLHPKPIPIQNPPQIFNFLSKPKAVSYPLSHIRHKYGISP